MRMWMLPPIILCQQHLLGEHNEIHKHKHNFEKQHKMDGRIKPIPQIIPVKMQERHDELAKEMLRRDRNHKSPYKMPSISYLPLKYLTAKANIEFNINDLITRCSECKKRYIQYKYHNSVGL